MKTKPTPIPDCNICHKSGYVIVKNTKGERVAKKCECREPVPKQDDFSEVVNNF